MVRLDRIYTRGGDSGETSLATGARRRKDDIRVEAFGAIDETNAAIGIARLAIAADNAALDAMLARIQNELFDLAPNSPRRSTPQSPWTRRCASLSCPPRSNGWKRISIR